MNRFVVFQRGIKSHSNYVHVDVEVWSREFRIVETSLLGCGGLHSTFRERRYSQANFTAKRNATAINVGEHSPRRPAITLIKT